MTLTKFRILVYLKKIISILNRVIMPCIDFFTLYSLDFVSNSIAKNTSFTKKPPQHTARAANKKSIETSLLNVALFHILHLIHTQSWIHQNLFDFHIFIDPWYFNKHICIHVSLFLSFTPYSFLLFLTASSLSLISRMIDIWERHVVFDEFQWCYSRRGSHCVKR